MKKWFMVLLLIIGGYFFSIEAQAQVQEKVIWDGAEIVKNQSGKMTFTKDVKVYKKDRLGNFVSMTVKRGNFFRVYDIEKYDGKVYYWMSSGYRIMETDLVVFKEVPMNQRVSFFNDYELIVSTHEGIFTGDAHKKFGEILRNREENFSGYHSVEKYTIIDGELQADIEVDTDQKGYSLKEFISGSNIKVLENQSFLSGNYIVKKKSNVAAKVVVFNAPQPFYMQKEPLIKIGQLEPGIKFAIISEDEYYYELLFGETKVYVKKMGEVVNESTIETIANNASVGAIKTNAVTNIYKESNVSSKILLQLEAGYRYPILGKIDEWFIVKMGEQIGYINTQTVQIDVGIPVLTYHHILPEAQLNQFKNVSTTVTAKAFEEQMAYLATNDYTTIESNDIYEYLEGRKILPANSVLITFDDGLLSSKEYAYPILNKYQFKAIQHIISIRKDLAKGIQKFNPNKLQFLTDEEMTLMSDVFIYEAHTFNLHIWDEVTKSSRLMEVSAEELRDDLRQNLEDIPTAIAFAYPFGQNKEETIEVIKELGFFIGFTTVQGYANMLDSRYKINRYGPTQKTTMSEFIKYVQGEMQFLGKY